MPEKFLEGTDFKKNFLWIAEKEGAPIGFFDFEIGDEKQGYFVFYVAPQWRRKGFGRVILEKGFVMPEVEKCIYLEGGVKKENKVSRRILESMGFTNTGPDEDGMLMYKRNN